MYSFLKRTVLKGIIVYNASKDIKNKTGMIKLIFFSQQEYATFGRNRF